MVKKLKVQYQTHRFLLILQDEDFDSTLYQLKSKIEERLHEEMGAPQNICEIQTVDGFAVSLKEKVGDVFENGAVVSCVDMGSFKERNHKLLDTKKFFIDAKVEDFKDNLSKWAQVGSHAHGKVFVRWGKGNAVDKFYLLSKTEILEKLANPTAQNLSIGRSQEANWFIEARLVVEPENQVSIVIIIKTGSKKGIYCDKIFLKLPEKGYKIDAAGDVVHVSAGDEEAEDDSLISYELPAPKKTGGEIVEKLTTTSAHTQEGDSLITMTHNLDKKVEPSMDSWARDGVFKNYFIVPEITFVNTGSAKMSVVKTSMEYYDGSKWQPMSNISIGTAYPSGWGGFDYEWFNDGTNFVLDAGSSVSLAVHGAIQCAGNPGSNNFMRARAHSSLPQPLQLKVVVEDSNGKKKSLVVEQANKSLGLPTKAERKNAWSLKKDLEAFIYCDDTDALERSFVALYLDNEYELVIRPSTSYTYTWDYETLGSFAFKAVEEKKTEYELADMSDEKMKFTLLVDLERQKVYALKVFIKTATSSVEETVLLPKVLKVQKK